MKPTLKPNMLNARPIMIFAGMAWALVSTADAFGAAERLSISDFKYCLALEGEAAQAVAAKVILPATLIANAADGFADLRLFDSDGNEIPYAIREEFETVHPESIRFKTTHFEEQEQADLFILEAPEATGQFESLEIVTPEVNFKKKAVVEYSQDGANWSLAGEGLLYDYSAKIPLRQTILSFPSIQARYLRVSLENPGAPTSDASSIHLQYKDLVFQTSDRKGVNFRIDRFVGHHKAIKAENIYEQRFAIPNPKTTIDTEDDTILDLGYIGLPFYAISLDAADPFFYRNVELWISGDGKEETYVKMADGTICRVPQIPEPSLKVYRTPSKAHYVKVKIRNEDNPPLRDLKVDLLWNSQALYFFPEKGHSYTLYFGNPDAPQPSYETGRLVFQDTSRPLPGSDWQARAMQENSHYKPTVSIEERQMVHKHLLTASVILLTAALGIWAAVIIQRAGKANSMGE